MMGCRHDGSPVEQNFNDLVIVGVGGEDERGDVGGEGGRVGGERLPALINENHSSSQLKSERSKS